MGLSSLSDAGLIESEPRRHACVIARQSGAFFQPRFPAPSRAPAVRASRDFLCFVTIQAYTTCQGIVFGVWLLGSDPLVENKRVSGYLFRGYPVRRQSYRSNESGKAWCCALSRPKH
jgi:hypothetical protein